MKRITVIILLLFLSINAQGQQNIGQWKTFTDMKSVRNAVRVGNSIWAATNSGVFVFDIESEQYKKFDISSGLSSNDILCIAAESGKRIWAGGSNGFINTYDLQTETWSTIDANRPNDDSQKGVNGFFLKGDTMFVATVFGVIPFKISKWEFGDTYANFGFSSAPVVKCVLTDAKNIYVGTNKGLAVASLTASNLSAPDSWTVSDPLPITGLSIFRDTLAIVTEDGLRYYKNGSSGAVGAYTGKSISCIRVNGGRLLILRNEGPGFIVESLSYFTQIPQVVDSNSTVQGTSLIPVSNSLWISTTSNGLTQRTASGWKYYYPYGPKSNIFNSIVVDDDGVLWAASGSSSAAGFCRYDPSLPEDVQWKNFPGFGFYQVSLGTKGSVWVSSWGSGIVEVASDSIRKTLNYYSSPSLPGFTSEYPAFVVSSSVAVDPQGKTWIANHVDGSGRSLIRLDSDTSGTYFDNQYYSQDGWFHPMVIDRNGTKWLGGELPSFPKNPKAGLDGAYVFNENVQLYGIQTINGWGHLSTSDGLKSDLVLSFAVDLDGAVWIGTSQGVTIIPDPQFPRQPSLCYALQAYVPFVQTIAVDALNNKWIGTNDGVFVVNSDGSQLLPPYYKITSANSQLISDNVRSIAIDQKRGIVYFGTEQGLSSLAIEAVQANQSYSELEVGPNPFILPSEQQLMIRNLVAGSTIKIVTVGGFLVKQFEAQGGGRAFWDGRDKNGALVSSGIYFIIAFAENGSKTVVGKVAVIRR
jgi:ligand-binding sensor domain-containing protein